MKTFPIKNLRKKLFSFILISLGEKKEYIVKKVMLDLNCTSLIGMCFLHYSPRSDRNRLRNLGQTIHIHEHADAQTVMLFKSADFYTSFIGIWHTWKNIMYPYLNLHVYSIGGIRVLLWDKYITSSAYDHVGWKIYLQLIAYYIFLTYFV